MLLWMILDGILWIKPSAKRISGGKTKVVNLLAKNVKCLLLLLKNFATLTVAEMSSVPLWDFTIQGMADVGIITSEANCQGMIIVSIWLHIRKHSAIDFKIIKNLLLCKWDKQDQYLIGILWLFKVIFDQKMNHLPKLWSLCFMFSVISRSVSSMIMGNSGFK